jgi:putative transposase
MRYRRADAAGGTYFFTVNLAERRADVLVRHIDDLRAAMSTVKDAHPFAVLAYGDGEVLGFISFSPTYANYFSS